MSDIELHDLSENSEEDAPLIGLDEVQQPTQRKPTAKPSKSCNTDLLRPLGMTLFVSVLYVFNDISRYLASLRLIGQGICREYHAENDTGLLTQLDGSIPEELCTAPIIQQRLARVSGYMLSLEALLAFLLTIPYGLMLDRLSEPVLAGLNIAGFLMSSAWLSIVCFNWSLFPTWMVVLAPVFSVVGGGASIFESVIYVIVARQVPATSRSLYFSLFSAAGLLTQIVSLTATASFLDRGYLFTPMMLNFPIGIIALIALSLIRPGGPGGDPRQNNSNMGQRTWRTLQAEIRSTLFALTRLVARPGGPSLLAAVPLAKMADPLAEVTLLFVQRKFGTSFSYASRVLTFQTIEGLILLASILPLVKHVSQTRLHYASTLVDLFITRGGFLLMCAGCFIMGLAEVWIPYVLGLIILTLGWGTGPALKSVLTDMINAEEIPALYTVLALCDSIGMALGSLVLNRSYALGVGWDNLSYLGLPFFVASLCFFIGGVGTFVSTRCGRIRDGLSRNTAC